MKRVVVTGVGAISPVGASAAESFSNLLEGRSGTRATSIELDERFPSRIAGEVPPFDAGAVLGARQARRNGRFTQLAAIAAAEAMEGSGLSQAGYAAERLACIIGVGIGGLEACDVALLALRERGPQRVSPFGIPSFTPNMAAGVVAETFGLRGHCFGVSSACASGAHAIGQALLLLRAGAVDAVLCGGSEGCLIPLTFACFGQMGALSVRNDRPEVASRPFDRGRDGFVLAEGAAMMVLETQDAAERRGAPILASLLGFGASADAHHATQPDPEGGGARRAMNGALMDAGIRADAVQYVNAHGTSTQQNDLVETRAVHGVFGDHARTLAVSSTKGATGHMLGAAGAFEAVVTTLAVQSGRVPPTLNLEEIDPECDLDYVPQTAREGNFRVAMTNSFGFGGQNASLIFAQHGRFSASPHA